MRGHLGEVVRLRLEIQTASLQGFGVGRAGLGPVAVVGSLGRPERRPCQRPGGRGASSWVESAGPQTAAPAACTKGWNRDRCVLGCAPRRAELGWGPF